MDKFDVFISYSWRADKNGVLSDKILAERLEVELLSRGLTVWRDVHQIRAGEVIPRALEDGVRNSTLVVPLLSDLHQASNVCRWEVLSALAQASVDARVPPVFPVVREGRGIPLAYPAAVFEANAFAWDGSDMGLQELCNAIQTQLGVVRAAGGERPPSQQRPRFVGAPGVTGARFVGRFPDLMRMYARLVSGLAPLDAAAGRHGPMLLLHGEPGMGKSSLAAFFAEWFAGRFAHGVLWLDAAGDRVDASAVDESQRETVLRSLSAGAERWLRDPAQSGDSAGLPLDPTDRWEELRKRIAKHLNATGGRLLLVVDDVPRGVNPADLAVPSESVAMLLTARGASLAHQGVDSIRVDVFQPFESMLLLTNARDPDGALRRRREDPWRGAEPVAAELAEEVGHHPMAVDLLGLRLRDSDVEPSSLLDEVRRNAPDFLDVQDVTLPLLHRGSILATVSGSLRSAVRLEPTAASVLRLLAVAPAGRPVRLDALSFAVAPDDVDAALLVDELTGHGLVRIVAGADGDLATQHQIVHAVSRELWRRDDDPFRPGPARPREPDLSHRFAHWHHHEGERLRNTDDTKAAETHGVVLHVLSGARATGEPGREQVLQTAYALLAQARLTYRVGSNDPADYDTAFNLIEQGKATLLPHMQHLAVQFAFHTAEALRGLVLSKGSGVTPEDKDRAAREALDVILAADDARSRIAAVVLAQPPDASDLDHDYVRDVLARSRFNIPGRTFGIVASLRRGRPHGWVAEARELLGNAERSYLEVIALRREMWGSDPVDVSQILSQASSEHGVGMARYYQALLPQSHDERLQLLGGALPQLLVGLEMRDRGRNEGDVCKSLVLLLKVLLAAEVLETGDADGVLAAQRARWDAAVADAEQFHGMRLTPDERSAPLHARRAELRDGLTAQLAAAGDDMPSRPNRDAALQAVVGWLALAHVAAVWNPGVPELPNDLEAELREFGESR